MCARFLSHSLAVYEEDEGAELLVSHRRRGGALYCLASRGQLIKAFIKGAEPGVHAVTD